jgi:hypothetical protein
VIQLSDVPIGACLTLFFAYVGYSIFLAIAQVVFLNRLLPQLQNINSELTKIDIIKAGAIGLKDFVPPERLNEVLVAYSRSLNGVFYVAVASTAAAVIMSRESRFQYSRFATR